MGEEAVSEKTVKAIGYIRCSTQEQADSGLGLSAQRRKIAAYCVAKGFDLDPKDVYEDAGHTGWNTERPALIALRERIASGSVDVVVLAKMDRLSRRVKDLIALVDELQEVVQIVFVQEGLDTTTPTGRCMMTVFAAFNQLEVETTRERTKVALAERAATGARMGRAPYGFRPLKDKGFMVVPEEIEWVDLVFRLHYIEGYGLRTVARHLELRGFDGWKPTPWRVRDCLGCDLYLSVVSREVREAAVRKGRVVKPLPVDSKRTYDPEAPLAKQKRASA